MSLKTTLANRIWLWLHGWRSSRDEFHRLLVPSQYELFPLARAILAQFGNLRFGNRNERIQIDPGGADEVVAEIRQFEADLGIRLYPIGFVEHQDREYFFVDMQGAAYLLCNGLRPIGPDIVTALRYLSWRAR